MSEELTTRPMFEALLERIQALENKVIQTAEATNVHIEHLMANLRTEINVHLTRVRDEIAILNEDTLKTRAGERELIRRIEELEAHPKAS